MCFASTLSNHRTKFAPRAKKCVFLGYPFEVKGYKVLDLSTHSVFISRDVVFHEHSFPFASISINVAGPFAPLDVEVASFSLTGIDSFVTPISIPNLASIDSNDASPPSFVNPNSVDLTSLPFMLADTSSPNQVPNAVSSSPPVALSPPVPLSKSTRDTRPPAYLQDYACTTIATSTPYDLAQCLTYSHLEPCYHSYFLAVNSSPKEPQSFSQAVQDPLWKATMDK